MTTEAATNYRMLGQIRDTGRAIRLALEPEFRASVADQAERIASVEARRIYATGCGTSFHAAIHARYLFRHLAGIDVVTISTSDLLQSPPVDLDAVPVLVYSHSGVSKATVDAALAARQRSPLVAAVLNVDGTPLCDAASLRLLVPGGRDTALAKSKSFTTVMLVNTLLAMELGKRTGHRTPASERWDEWMASIPSTVDAAVGMEVVLANFVARVGDVGNWLFVGSNVNSLIAMEAALKMKEANYAVAEGYETEEAGHGRLQPVETSSMVVAIATEPALDDRLSDVVRAARAIGARVTVVAPAGETAMSRQADELLTVPDVPHTLLTPLVNVVPMQLLAYQAAVRLGYNPDLIRTDDPRYARANGIIFPPGTH